MRIEALSPLDYQKYELEFDAHPLQTYAWGELKQETTEVLRYGFFLESTDKSLQEAKESTQAQECVAIVTVLVKRIPWLKLGFGYIPRGIACQSTAYWQSVLSVLVSELKAKGLFFLAIDPDIPFTRDWQQFSQRCQEVEKTFQNLNFLKTKAAFQTTRTIVIDLSRDLQAIFADIKPEYRRCIRKAEKHGVQIHLGTEADLLSFYEVYTQIAQRRKFPIHPLSYYQKIYTTFVKENRGFLLVAKMPTEQKLQKLNSTQANLLDTETINLQSKKTTKKVDSELDEQTKKTETEKQQEQIDSTEYENIKNRIVGGYLVLCNGQSAFEMYGGCLDEVRPWKVNHLLKWQSFVQAKQMGKLFYDQWGAELFMPGIKEFKESFGGQTVQLPKQYGISLYPLGLQIYQFLVWLNNRRQGRRSI